MTERHTLKHFREFWYSPLIDRNRHDAWVDGGSLSMSDRVRAKAAEILANHTVPELDPAVVRFIDETIARRDLEALTVSPAD